MLTPKQTELLKRLRISIDHAEMCMTYEDKNHTKEMSQDSLDGVIRYANELKESLLI
jgi:hypothetical protein